MVIQPTLRDLSIVMLRRKWVFIVIYAVIMAAGVGYLLTATPQYQSEAVLIVRFGEKIMPDLARNSEAQTISQNDRHETVNSDVAMLTSRDQVAKVINTIGLKAIYPKIAETVSGEDKQRDAAIAMFQTNLRAETSQDSEIIKLSLLHPDPAMAQRLERQLLTEYYGLENLIYSDPAIQFQEAQVKSARANLEAEQKALEQFKQRTNIVAFQNEVTDLIDQRSDAEQNLAGAQAREAEAKQRVSDLQRLLSHVAPELANPDPGEKYHALDDAQARLDTLRQEEQRLLNTYRASSPVVQQLRANIAVAEATVRRNRSDSMRRGVSAPNSVYLSLQTDYLRAQADARAAAEPITVISANIAALNQRLKALEADRRELDDRTRAVDLADQTYRALVSHLEDARVTDARNRANISHTAVISQPTRPTRPAKPRKLLILAACLMAGMLLGIGGAVFVEVMDDRFSTGSQLSVALQVPVFGQFERLSHSPGGSSLTRIR